MRNRQLKFRVWNPEQNKMEYFELDNITFPERLLTQDKHPVQQYTGMKDSKGVEIYEGDILKDCFDTPIEFEEGKFVVKAKGARVYDLCEFFEGNRKPVVIQNYKNVPVNVPYGDEIKFVDVKNDTEEKLAGGFVDAVFEIIELRKENKKLQEMFDMKEKTEEGYIDCLNEVLALREQNAKLQEMFDMQVKLVTALELEKIEAKKLIDAFHQDQTTLLVEREKLNDKAKQLELDNEELHSIIKTLTKGKLPCNPDHNGECLACDNWLSDCPLNKKK